MLGAGSVYRKNTNFDFRLLEQVVIMTTCMLRGNTWYSFRTKNFIMNNKWLKRPTNTLIYIMNYVNTETIIPRFVKPRVIYMILISVTCLSLFSYERMQCILHAPYQAKTGMWSFISYSNPGYVDLHL